jgi:hypothetical protein
MAEQAVYWVGQDGNVYFGGGQGGGVQNMGKLLGTPSAVPYRPGYGFDAERGSGLAQRINDPALNKGSAVPTIPTAPKNNPLNQGAVDATNQSLNSLGQILTDAYASAQTGYDNAMDQLNAQEATQRARYDQESLKNQQNYDANLGASLRAGKTGLSGLMSALRGGGGSGNEYARNWVQNTVADTTANDIREGYNTFDKNRTAQDNNLSTFLTDLSGKRRENEDELTNSRRAAQLYDAQQKQSLYQKLADLYGDSGNVAENARYLSLAGGQAGNIASNMGAHVSRYNSDPIKVQSPDMTAFASPEQQAMSASDNGKGTGIFSMLDPRRREKELAGV